MRRTPNAYEECAMYMGAKEAAFASPGDEYAAALRWLSRVEWLKQVAAQQIAQKASERAIHVNALLREQQLL
jgi:hypothetical protein